MKKTFFVLFVVAVIAGGAYFLGSYRNSEVSNGDVAFLSSMKNDFGLNSSEIVGARFDWNFIDDSGNIDKESIFGHSYDISEVTVDQYEDIMTFFRDSGFEADLVNSLGDESFSYGFKKDEAVCILRDTLAEIKESGARVHNLEIKCGGF